VQVGGRPLDVQGILEALLVQVCVYARAAQADVVLGAIFLVTSDGADGESEHATLGRRGRQCHVCACGAARVRTSSAAALEMGDESLILARFVEVEVVALVVALHQLLQ